MDELTKKRALLKSKLSRFETFLNTQGEEKRDQLKIRLEKIINLLDEYDLVQADIELLDHTQESDRDAFENRFYDVITNANKIINQFEMDNNVRPSLMSNSPSGGMSTQLNVKLPKISLPEFNGSYEKWLTFADAFRSLIHENEQLNNVQKFYYLRSCLKGEAAHVINSLEASDANYIEAWELLKNRYENKRIIVFTHVRELFDFPAAHHESYAHLRKLVDHFQKHVRSLCTLGQPTDSWDTLLIHLVVSKLDTKTKRSWEGSIKSSTLPDLKQLFEFLSSQCMILESLEKNKNTNKTNPVACVVTSKSSCKLCQENHALYQCAKFLDLPIKQRFEKVKNWKLCINCLRVGHTSVNCKASNCKKCKRSHNTLLHFEKTNEEEQPATNSQNAEIVAAHTITKHNDFVLLSTAMIWLKDSQGNLVECRALIDSCSQSNFITNKLASRLNLKQSKVTASINGISLSTFNTNAMVQIELFSVTKRYQKKLPFLIIDKITDKLPQQKIDIKDLNIPENIQLADPRFNEPGNIDALLGACVFFELLSIGQIKLTQGGPILQKTKLGWIISGSIPATLNNQSCFLATHTKKNDSELIDAVERFWKIEEPFVLQHFSQEELDCEKHFCNTVERLEDGQFQVSLPLKNNWQELGESLELTEKRLLSLEKRFANNPELKGEYSRFMEEYESLGHMSAIEQAEMQSNCKINYLPHHCVFKMSSSTTKLRVVFDASAKTSSNLSLNDVLKVGPVVQDDLISIIFRFRFYNYVVTGDIEKMYRQIKLDPSQRDLQRIIWRDKPNIPVKHYRLNTVTYGTASASYLSTRCLKQLAEENNTIFPQAARAIRQDFYMDDLLTGANTVEEILKLKEEICDILSKAHFRLRKFNSNNRSLNDNDDMKSLNVVEPKILGVLWGSTSDEFKFVVNVDAPKRFTKRSILATISQIFDPLGLIGPIILRGKLLLQKLWQQKTDWDETVPQDLYIKTQEFFDDLNKINNVTIPRQVTLPNSVLYQMIGFCDASELAYGACVYIRSIDARGKVFSRLLTAKSKVAPIKVLTIPRLELSAAVLLSKLMNNVKTSVNVPIDRVWYFSDSNVVLSWLSMTPNTLKTFVANRVCEIQNNSDVKCWYHVCSKDNPADIISRGINSHGIKDNNLWWCGPNWLTLENDLWPIKQNKSESVPEMKTVTLTTIIQNYDEIFGRYSSWTKLQRIIAYCLRFKTNCLRHKESRNFGNITNEELENSTVRLIKLVQKHAFGEDIANLEAQRINKNSSLRSLDPFIGKDGILRVGGRLSMSTLNFSQKHPIILPQRHKITDLIIKQKHLENLHAGVQTLLSIIRLEYWPIRAKNVIKRILKSCTICFRVKPRSILPKMGILPKERTTPTRPFFNVGLDYAGPILIKDGKLRNRKYIKSYICVFVCLVTRAVHLELVTDLTTDTFLNALKRFVSRRGLCCNIYSDNATNFRGANNQIKKTLSEFKKDGMIQNFLGTKHIDWHFIPPRSPHFGGIWEAAVKSIKHHLIRVIGNEKLTYETMCTILIQIEAILNSRPLLPLSCDPNDLEVLTPGHFLIGTAMVAIPDKDISEIATNRLTNYRQLQKMYQSFWKRWSAEYLHTLQQRSKWMFDHPNAISVGDLVLVKEDCLPPLKWPRGRIEELHRGPDGRVRVVKIRTSQGSVTRSVHNICPLPKDN